MLVVAEHEQFPRPRPGPHTVKRGTHSSRRYQLPLYAYVFELVRNEQTSLDIVQETFINAVRHIGSLQHDEKFGSWLFGIAHQKCIQQWRREGTANRRCGKNWRTSLQATTTARSICFSAKNRRQSL